jgi:hypothetical protein
MASAFSGVSLLPDSRLLRRIASIRLNMSTSRHLTFLNSTFRHVVEAARTGAQCATIHPGLVAATSLFCSCGNTLPISRVCSGKIFTSSASTAQHFACLNIRRRMPTSMFTVRPDTLSATRLF